MDEGRITCKCDHETYFSIATMISRVFNVPFVVNVRYCFLVISLIRLLKRLTLPFPVVVISIKGSRLFRFGFYIMSRETNEYLNFSFTKASIFFAESIKLLLREPRQKSFSVALRSAKE